MMITHVPHDGLAEVLVRLDAGKHKSVTRVQMSDMRTVHPSYPQSSSASFASECGAAAT
jgi:hypothetical protein